MRLYVLNKTYAGVKIAQMVKLWKNDVMLILNFIETSLSLFQAKIKCFIHTLREQLLQQNYP